MSSSVCHSAEVIQQPVSEDVDTEVVRGVEGMEETEEAAEEEGENMHGMREGGEAGVDNTEVTEVAAEELKSQEKRKLRAVLVHGGLGGVLRG
jgi:hypothetical protein